MNALATSLQTYFTTFAHDQRDLSAHTIASYRDTWRLLLKHLEAPQVLRRSYTGCGSRLRAA